MQQSTLTHTAFAVVKLILTDRVVKRGSHQCPMLVPSAGRTADAM